MGARVRHGCTRTPEYKAWQALKQRCLNPNDARYPDYGGRGITVCKRWLKFENFLADMGGRPASNLSLDRRDNSRGYNKSNCRWATRVEQNRNRRQHYTLWYKGRPLKEWAAVRGVKYHTLRARFRRTGSIA